MKTTTELDIWPALPLEQWKDTCETLHLWTQIVGKIRMGLTPHLNHWWEVPLYISCHGLTTSPIPYGHRSFEITFDFLHHHLRIECSDGSQQSVPLRPMAVAEFYNEVMQRLRDLDISVDINVKPQELPNPLLFPDDRQHASYDEEMVRRFWRILLESDRVLKQFRARFIGKSSPVHFFWGSFDLAVTRFSGRPAPPRKGSITGDAYSHECSSVGFWPGGPAHPSPAYYAYAAPAPPNFDKAAVQPQEAYYDPTLSEFLLPYDAVRQAVNPDEAILAFAQSTYEAAATLGKWDRAVLEKY